MHLIYLDSTGRALSNPEIVMKALLAVVVSAGTNAAQTVQPGDLSHFDLAGWITALATFFLLLAAIVVAWAESRRHRFAQSVELILKFDDQFNSLEFLKYRDAAAKCLKAQAYKTAADKCSKDADAVLDFFETVGYLLRRGALDEQMVWHTFWHWIMGYYQAAAEYITEARKKDSALWQDFVELHRRMEAIEPYTIASDEFLSEEIDCSGDSVRDHPSRSS